MQDRADTNMGGGDMPVRAGPCLSLPEMFSHPTILLQTMHKSADLHNNLSHFSSRMSHAGDLPLITSGYTHGGVVVSK